MRRSVLALIALAAPLRGQQDGFLDRVRDGSARFRERAVAIAEGYRPIGPEAPAMGQHWINMALATDGAIDPSRPPILTYATIDGEPRLLGVAFVVPLAPGRSAPDGPAGRGKWHIHGRALEAEGHVLNHAHGPAAHDSGWRVAVLHAWVWAGNPEGPFAAENWSLPYLRVGVDATPRAPRDAGRALALAAGGAAFYTAQLRVAARLDAADAQAVARVTAEYAGRVAVWAAPRRGRSLDPEEIAWLEMSWREYWRALSGAASAEARPRLLEVASALPN